MKKNRKQRRVGGLRMEIKENKREKWKEGMKKKRNEGRGVERKNRDGRNERNKNQEGMKKDRKQRGVGGLRMKM